MKKEEVLNEDVRRGTRSRSNSRRIRSRMEKVEVLNIPLPAQDAESLAFPLSISDRNWGVMG